MNVSMDLAAGIDYAIHRLYIDGHAMHAAHPDTFYIPSRDDIKCLVVGDYVKVGFKVLKMAERMWVIITGFDTGGFIHGELNNDPVLATHVACGELVTFHEKNVLDILKGNPSPVAANCTEK